MMRRRLAVVVSCAIVLLTGARTLAPAGAAPRAQSSDPATLGQSLATQFFTLIQKKDAAGLDKMLSPAFQLERADGTGTGKAEYLKSLPTLNSFELSNFSAKRVGSVLVVRYLATATGLVNGKPYTPGPAPRLSVFVRTGAEGHYRCGRCNSEAVAARRRRAKEILVAEAGGACAACGFSAYLGALQFHHRDPALKSFEFSRQGVTRSLQKLRQEAQKCVLLCANCHAMAEAGLLSVPAQADDTGSTTAARSPG